MQHMAGISPGCLYNISSSHIWLRVPFAALMALQSLHLAVSNLSAAAMRPGNCLQQRAFLQRCSRSHSAVAE
jgi:hypothetical protein